MFPKKTISFVNSPCSPHFGVCRETGLRENTHYLDGALPVVHNQLQARVLEWGAIAFSGRIALTYCN